MTGAPKAHSANAAAESASPSPTLPANQSAPPAQPNQLSTTADPTALNAWPISISSITHTQPWHSFAWEITNKKTLAKHIAYIAAGYHLHIENILRKLDKLESTTPHTNAIAAAIKALAPPQNQQQKFHRDGWLFQLIAWLAALAKASPTDILRAPQIRKADHGLDGIIIHTKTTALSPAGVRICEQKATDNPRNKISQQVWPEIDKHEQGDRDHEIVAELTTILQRINPHSAQSLAEKALWQDQRSYSVAVTTKSADPSEHSTLFAGFDAHAQGSNERRHGETLTLDNLRDWMDDLASLVISDLHAMEK
ncbi:hypothetical protein [Corallococcus sp. AB038B]|uniref:hypothetical protein n=1 Tax=Corallococcus sp. AB038B TaxID=2316718 RepID=UPI0011C3CDB9|nr:hypothetical protein [Corallococcus sp. AB038B]